MRNGVQASAEHIWNSCGDGLSICKADDHLRNHGFLLPPEGWILSPAYDLGLALEVAPLFRGNASKAQTILHEVKSATAS